MKRALALAIVLLLCGRPARAQVAAPAGSPPAPGIQDNSFLIEEAYNQEPGVVQHISSFVRSFEGRGWAYSFTQEWPVPGVAHQLSYTLLLASVGPGDRGLGDLALNYRHQLVGDGEAKVALAPRLSVLFPTGSARKGLGAGGIGVQASLPLSLVLSPRFVAHANAGLSHVFSARDPAGDRADVSAGSLGASVVCALSPRFDVLVETLWIRAETVTGPSRREHADAWLLSPGVRWAYNFRSGLQIVPGLAFPIGVGPSRGQTSLFVYLSFEHPFRKRSR
jgi:hypothetical protein